MALHERNVTLGHKLTETRKAHSRLWFVNPAVCIYNPLHQELALHKCTFYDNRTYRSKYIFFREKFPFSFELRCVEKKLYVILQDCFCL